MRLLKAQNTNLRNIYGKGVKYDVNGQVIMDTTNVMLVPKGNTDEFITSPVDGHIRYNTDLNELQVVSENEWRSVRYKEPNNDPGIIQQPLGNGAGIGTGIVLFGPLDSQDPNLEYTAPAAAQNILVFVENVFQISTTNYTLVQNPSSTGTGQEVESGNFIIGEQYIITATGVTDFVTEHGAADNNPGTTFTAASAGTSDATGLARLTGYYLSFTSEPDLNKPVTVLHNFDK
jgi:hypothetical protein